MAGCCWRCREKTHREEERQLEEVMKEAIEELTDIDKDNKTMIKVQLL